MKFGNALDALEEGKAVARAGWNGKGMSVQKQVPDEHSKMSLPYAYITTVQGERVPWLVSQTDLFATDWMVVDPQ
jgi:hypothetical protein